MFDFRHFYKKISHSVEWKHPTIILLPYLSAQSSPKEKCRTTEIWKIPQIENVFVRPRSALEDGCSQFYEKRWFIRRWKEPRRASSVEIWRWGEINYGTRENTWAEQPGLDPYGAQRSLLAKLVVCSSFHQVLWFLLEYFSLKLLKSPSESRVLWSR